MGRIFIEDHESIACKKIDEMEYKEIRKCPRLIKREAKWFD
jgi:hypothetical protein